MRAMAAFLAVLLLAAPGCDARQVSDLPKDNPRALTRTHNGCSAASQDCSSCLDAGCSWQGEGKCFDRCLIPDASCFSGKPSGCPVPQEVCSSYSDCEACTSAGCTFQQGACKSQCIFGPFGPIATCFSDKRSCPATRSLDRCSAASRDCGSCLEAGCSWQGEGRCFDDCLLQDTFCFSGKPSRCPVPQEVCSSYSDCEACTSAGCTFQQGACKSQCRFGPMGKFIAECFSDKRSCPAAR